MNLIQALNGLTSPAGNGENGGVQHDKPAEPLPPSRTAPPEQTVNVMASVLERHEQISNRVKNKK